MPDQDLPDRDRLRGAGADGPGDPATELLLAAFDHEVRTQPVDEQRLAAGTRIRLRRRRRVRRVQVAAAALVVAAAIPVAVQAWPTSSPAVSTVPIAQSPSQSTSPAPSGASSSPATESTEGGELSIADVAYDIPDMTRARSTLPGGQTLTSIDGVAEQRRAETPQAGPVGCAMNPADVPGVAKYSVAGRQFEWADEEYPRHDVTLRATGWPAGTGAAAFAAAISEFLGCQTTTELAPVNLTVPGADQSWTVTADLGGSPAYLTGSARVGDLIVSASLAAPTPEEAAARSGELAALLSAAVEDLRTSGLSVAEGR